MNGLPYFSAWATLAVLGVYFWTWVMAARARLVYKVPAPSMDGPEGFLRAHRVQMNTLEVLPLILPPLWLCAFTAGDLVAAGGALVWCVARILYARGYYRDPARREFGFVLGMLASAGLIGASAVALLLAW